MDTSPQLALYCLDLGIHHAGFVEIRRDGSLRTIMTVFDDAQLARWKRYFDAQFAALSSREAESDYRLAKPNSGLCSPKWCTFWQRCPGGEGR